MHVLFVTDSRFDKQPSGDGSTRYRCFNVAEALIASGHRATVASLPEVMTKYLGRYDVISVLRPRAGARLKKLVQAARRQNIRLVADFDDLIFDVTAAPESPLVLNNFADEKTVARGFQRFATACQWFDEITVSTEPLAIAADRCFSGTPVYVLANGLSPLWLKHADESLITEQSSNGQCISYLPGTRSHDADFRSIQTAVSEWLAADENRILRIVGELSVDSSIATTQQVVREPLVPFFKLPEIIASSGITLAPLVSNKFNRAKSHIKFLESAAFGIPVVATPNPDIEQHKTVDGLHCPESAESWSEDLALAVSQSVDRDIQIGLTKYVRYGWTSLETAKPTLIRWLQMVAETSGLRSAASMSYPDDPGAFFLSLRPVPRFYTLNGWRPDRPTNLIIFESESQAEFDALNVDEIERRVKSTGMARDQWLVLISGSADRQVHDQWPVRLRRWKPAADHIEVIYPRTAADRCSLVYQCDHRYWLTAESCPDGLSSDRTCTRWEVFRMTLDRWRRKARKFRESPGRFFADSRIVSAAGRRAVTKISRA